MHSPNRLSLACPASPNHPLIQSRRFTKSSHNLDGRWRKKGASVTPGFPVATVTCWLPRKLLGKFDDRQSFVRAVDGHYTDAPIRWHLKADRTLGGKEVDFHGKRQTPKALRLWCAPAIRGVWHEGHEPGKTETSRDWAIWCAPLRL